MDIHIIRSPPHFYHSWIFYHLLRVVPSTFPVITITLPLSSTVTSSCLSRVYSIYFRKKGILRDNVCSMLRYRFFNYYFCSLYLLTRLEICLTVSRGNKSNTEGWSEIKESLLPLKILLNV